jgi:apolipoprotein D and lipocalin family protein
VSRIAIIGSGFSGLSGSKLKEVKGVAWIRDANSPAKLKVRFFWPLSGKYWVIELDADYQYAMVGHPSWNYFWILSRNKKMDEETYKKLLDSAAKKGFDVNKIIKVNQAL